MSSVYNTMRGLTPLLKNTSGRSTKLYTPPLQHLLRRPHTSYDIPFKNRKTLYTSTIKKAPPKIFTGAKDFLPLYGTDYTELYCSNAKQSAHYFQSVFGFQPVAYAGLETGNKEKASYVLQQGKIKLVLTCTHKEDGEIAEHVKKHGDGVHKVALTVPDAKQAYYETTSRGAESYMEPEVYSDEYGEAVISGIKAYGDTVHMFIERKNYTGPFLPGFQAYKSPTTYTPVGLDHIDHTVANVGWNQMEVWSDFYRNVFGMTDLISFDDQDISTEYTALMSKVVTNGSGYVKFPINEPAHGKKKSQIEEYLDFYKGPGVQHLALSSNNILETVSQVKARGGEFLTVPGYYYDSLKERCGEIDEEVALLKEHNILVDRDEHGYMLQIFSKPLSDRPTLFFEIIQRKGAQSFGKGNFKALFEAIEAEQQKRQTL